MTDYIVLRELNSDLRNSDNSGTCYRIELVIDNFGSMFQTSRVYYLRPVPCRISTKVYESLLKHINKTSCKIVDDRYYPEHLSSLINSIHDFFITNLGITFY